MSQVNISAKKTIYSKEINKVMDTGFNVAINPTTAAETVSGVPTVEGFFENYNILFFDIPLTGSNSHSELIERSSEYVGLDLNLLLQQINQLEEQNRLLQAQIDEFNTNA